MQVEMNSSEEKQTKSDKIKTDNNNKNNNNDTSKFKNSKISQSSIDIDNMISSLLSVRGSRPGKEVILIEKDIIILCNKCKRHLPILRPD